jgi:signal transduction histidine kinase
MPRNPWLAIEAGTPPDLRAREVRREWERFVGAGVVNGLRAPVVDSWRRSRDAGISAVGRSWSAPAAVERDEAFARWEEHPLRDAELLIHDCLAGVADESEHLIVVTDAAGVLLQLEGDARLRSLAADSMNFTEGALWSENGAGTNGIGTALAADHAVQIFAAEHFVEVAHAWTCSAAPIHDPETGALLGAIDVSGLQKDVHPDSLAVTMTTARAVEGLLRYRLRERDARLLARYRGRLTGRADRRALVAPTGRPVGDDPRGWLRGARLELPPGGGELVLPSGERAVAEPVGAEEAYIVRELGGRRAPRQRDELHMLADEQDALRRLATAVAHNVPPREIFVAVAEELGPLLGADHAAVVRFEADATVAVVAGTGQRIDEVAIGTRLELDELPAVTRVLRTGRSARVGSAVASPIIVEGRLWGAVVASTRRESLRADTEERMANFAELVGIVIGNAESRAELTASRARVVAAADEARRRIRRDLHDGAQQRLVSTVLALKEARQALGEARGPAVELVDEAVALAERANRELRELAHGIMPATLARGGLRAGIQTLVDRIELPVSAEVTAQRLPPALEATAYFIVAEALTNTVKHARARNAQIVAIVDHGALRLEIRDDGVGGARNDGGSGLVGLRDRATAMGGELRVESAPGEGTLVAAALPIPPPETD